MKTSTDIKTESAHKYIAQLCKHFAHKVESTFSIDHEAKTAEGLTKFPMGQAVFTAKDNVLSVRAECENEQACKAMQGVFDSHIVKFAFREELEYKWLIE
ncbi:MAG: DUF2218 domain-containing protein [Alphaproteobacteria bacterium]|nr:DUF2218 domain-containing protein [Alphaproteobacteria bacterium]